MLRWVPSLALVALALAAYLLTAGAIPARIGADPAGSLIVEDVAVGSWLWHEGLRPGLGVSEAPDGEAGRDVQVGDRIVGVGPRSMGSRSSALVMAMAMVAGALVAWISGLPGPTVLLAGATGVLVAPVIASLGLPAALPFAGLPAFVAVMASRAAAPHRARCLLAGVVIGLASVTALAVPFVVPGLWPWPLLWHVPTLAGISVPLTCALAAVVPPARRTPREGAGTRVQAVLRNAVPLARRSELAGGERERLRLASELHNDALPELSAAIHSLDPSDEQASQTITQLQRTAAVLRDLVGERHAHVVEQAGLAAAVRSYSAYCAERVDVPIRVRIQGESAPMPKDVGRVVYRVTQAALLNAIQHSGADTIEVHLEMAPRRCVLRVADDGVGIDPTGVPDDPRRRHFGLAQMRFEAEVIGASLHVEAPLGSGTTVLLTWTA